MFKLTPPTIVIMFLCFPWLTAHGATDRTLEPGSPASCSDEAGSCLVWTIKRPDGHKFTAYEFGNPDGKPILFIHGYMNSYKLFDPQLHSGLAEEFRMVAVNLVGYGDSDKPVDPAVYTSTSMADDLNAMVDLLDLEGSVMVGFSLGASKINDYVARWDDEDISGIVYIGGLPDLGVLVPGAKLFEIIERTSGILTGNEVGLDQNIEGSIFTRGAVTTNTPDSKLRDTLLSIFMLVPPQVRALALTERMNGFVQQDFLANLDVPMLLVHGDRDEVVGVETSPATATLLDGHDIEVVIYDGSGHALQFERDRIFNRDLREFVTRVNP